MFSEAVFGVVTPLTSLFYLGSKSHPATNFLCGLQEIIFKAYPAARKPTAQEIARLVPLKSSIKVVSPQESYSILAKQKPHTK